MHVDVMNELNDYNETKCAYTHLLLPLPLSCKCSTLTVCPDRNKHLSKHGYLLTGSLEAPFAIIPFPLSPIVDENKKRTKG